MLRLAIRAESFPIAQTFTLARGSKTEAQVVVAEIRDDTSGALGRGEAVPYARYGESIEQTLAAMTGIAPAIEAGASREDLQNQLSPGAARNALDCALWDLEAKQTGVPVWQRAGLPAPKPVITAYTISLDTPDRMAAAARACGHRPLLKVKLGPIGASARIAAVAAAAPNARLIVDANEALTLQDLKSCAPELKKLGVELIEQPLPASDDGALAAYRSPVPLCADESMHGLPSLPEVAQRYQVVNIKLDKAGGLTEALALTADARALGLQIMVGCMVATSLSIAPALLLAQLADYVDLDGPLLLARDRAPGLIHRESLLFPPSPELWG